MNANETTINVATENMDIKKEKVLPEILQDYLNVEHGGNLPNEIFENSSDWANAKRAIELGHISIKKFLEICSRLNITCTISISHESGYQEAYNISVDEAVKLADND